jgi:hypothetical protein
MQMLVPDWVLRYVLWQDDEPVAPVLIFGEVTFSANETSGSRCECPGCSVWQWVQA